ncbi:MAG: hypothetical protein KC503_33195 [Myxococcales bacterium]|nr:hypothetical protein [Myxococcales bacterium]
MVRPRLVLLALLATLAAGCSVQPLLTVGRQCQHKIECAPGLVCDPTTNRCAVAPDSGLLPDGARPDATRDGPAGELGPSFDSTVDGRLVDSTVDGPVGDSSVDTAPPYKLSCSIDVKAGTHNCAAPVTQDALSPGSGRFTVDLAGYSELTLVARLCDPTGYALDVGNSPTNNGDGGDGGSRSNDSELQIKDTTLSIFGNDYNPAGGGKLIQAAPSYVPASGCAERTLVISDGQVTGSQGLSVTSPYIFRLNQPDSEGSPDAIVYLGLDRVVGSTARVGTGLERVDVKLR